MSRWTTSGGDDTPKMRAISADPRDPPHELSLDWLPRVPLAQGLTATVDWYRRNGLENRAAVLGNSAPR